MAASGFTPIQLYYSTTAAATPVAGNLSNGELAINITDGKLYYKDNGGVVKLLASNAATTNVSTISFGSTGLTPSTATSGAVTVAGTLAVANGGTGQTTASAAFNALSPITNTGDLIIGNGTNSATRLGIGSNGTVLTSNGTTASWASIPAGDVTAAGNNAFTGANTFYNATGQTFAQASTNDGIVLQGRAGGTSSYRVTFTSTTLTASRTVTLPNADMNFSTGLGVANGGTGTTTLTANNVILGNGTSAVQFVAPGTNGNVLVSNGTTWTSAAPAPSGLSQAKATGLNFIYGL